MSSGYYLSDDNTIVADVPIARSSKELEYNDMFGDNMDYIGGTSDLGSISADKVIHNKIIVENIVKEAVKQLQSTLNVPLGTQRVEQIGGLFRTTTKVLTPNVPAILIGKNYNRRSLWISLPPLTSATSLVIGHDPDISQSATYVASSNGFSLPIGPNSSVFNLFTVDIVWAVTSNTLPLAVSVLEEIIPSPT